MKEPVAVAFICGDENFLPVYVAVTSIIKNRRDDTLLDLFVIAAGLSDRNASLFNHISVNGIQMTVIQNHADFLTDQTTYGKSGSPHIPPVLLKYKLPVILKDYGKVLYLSGDIIVKADLYELFTTHIDGYCLAAVADSRGIYDRLDHPDKAKNPVNTGVILMNLHKLRGRRITQKIDVALQPISGLNQSETDLLNSVFKNEILLLPLKFNFLYAGLYRSRSKYTMGQLNEMYQSQYTSLLEIEEEAVIIHFSTDEKPWLTTDIPYAEKWYRYFLLAKAECPDIQPDDSIHYASTNASPPDAPKVSVIIPAYNIEDYISENLMSVVGQTLSDIQIICVNDGSTDRTPEIIESFAREDTRITVIHQSNQGVSAARNTGLAAAEGEYVYLLDGDDVLMDNALECLYTHAKHTQSQNVLFDAVTFYENEELKQVLPPKNSVYQRTHDYPGIFTGEELFQQMVHNAEYRVPVFIQFYERRFLADHGLCFKKGIIHEDVLFTFIVMLLSKRVTYIHQELCWRRVRPGSIMTIKTGYANYIGVYTSLIEMLVFTVSRSEDISASVFSAIKNHLSYLSKDLLTKYLGLPEGDRHVPQLLQPLPHLLSEMVYQPLLRHSESLTKTAAFPLPSQASNAIPDESANALARVNKELLNLREAYDRVLRSETYKMGKAVTFLPQKGMTFIKRIHSEGFVYSVKDIIRRRMNRFR